MITKEDLEEWRANPVTEAVMACVKALADGAKDEWIQASWDGGKADPEMLGKLKVKAETANDLLRIDIEDIEAWQSPKL